MRYCENCGKPLSDDDVFCTECGSQINEFGETISSSQNIPKSEIGDDTTASFSEEVHNHTIPDQPHPWKEDEPINDSTASEEPFYDEEPLYEDSPPPRKQKRKSPILPICVVILVLAAGGFVLWRFVLSSDSVQTGVPSGSPAISSSAVDNSPSSNTSLSSSLSSSVESEIPSSSDISENEPSQAEDNDSLLQVAERAISDGDYPTAIRVMEYILEDDPQNDTVARSLEQIKDTYKNSVLEEANGYVNQDRQEEAISVLNEAKAVLGDSAEINLLLSAIQSSSTPDYQLSPSTPTPAPTPAPYSPPAYYYPQNNYYILPQSSDRLLTYQDIAGLSQQDLMLARNEIFARHGRIFNDPDVRNYFESQIWYYGYIEPEDFTDTMLSDIEKDNIAFIQEYEKSEN